jgi:hypothetical protein
MKLLRAYILLTILVKFCFFYFVIYSLYLHHLIKKNPDNKNYEESLQLIDKVKNQVEFIFTIMVAILLIILFNPYKENLILDYETKLLLYLFGFLLIITSDWGNFFNL